MATALQIHYATVSVSLEENMYICCGNFYWFKEAHLDAAWLNDLIGVANSVEFI